MTIKSGRELNRSVLVGGLFIFVMIGVIYVAGAMSNAYFNNTREGLTSFVVSGLNKDAIIPVFLKNIAPDWFNYLFMLTLLSAAMSTLSNQFHTMGIAISRDIMEAGGFFKKKGSSDKKSIFAAKIGVFFMIIITLILGNILPKGYIAAGTALFFGLCTASFLPSLMGALFWKRATKEGALWSMVCGFFISLFWLLFVHVFTVKNFAWKPILGKSAWGFADPMIISLPLSALIFISVSLLTKKPEEEHIKICFGK
jgi:SSS family solute:Na+ symporter